MATGETNVTAARLVELGGGGETNTERAERVDDVATRRRPPPPLASPKQEDANGGNILDEAYGLLLKAHADLPDILPVRGQATLEEVTVALHAALIAPEYAPSALNAVQDMVADTSFDPFERDPSTGRIVQALPEPHEQLVPMAEQFGEAMVALVLAKQEKRRPSASPRDSAAKKARVPPSPAGGISGRFWFDDVVNQEVASGFQAFLLARGVSSQASHLSWVRSVLRARRPASAQKEPPAPMDVEAMAQLLASATGEAGINAGLVKARTDGRTSAFRLFLDFLKILPLQTEIPPFFGLTASGSSSPPATTTKH